MPPPTSDRTPSSRRSFRPQLTRLEDRATPAAITTAGTAATIDLNGFSIGEAVTITTTATGDITVTSGQGVTLNGGSSAPSQTFSGAITVLVSDSTISNTLTFDASTVAYTATFTVVLDNSPFTTTFNGLSDFGANALSVSTTRNIAVTTGATVATTSGVINFSANAAGTTFGDFIGIDVQGVVTSTSGAVLLSGHGGDDSAGSQYGIHVSGGGTVSTTGSGSVTLTGTGGSDGTVSGGGFNIGVVVSGTGSAVTSGGGSVSVTGTGGGGGGGGSNYGVDVQGGGQIAAGGTGTVAVSGTGGADSGAGNVGVLVTGANSAITSGGGSVSVTGIGGSGGGAFPRGVEVNSAGVLSSGGNAAITVTADSIELFSTTSINAGTGTVTLRPLTLGIPIDVGGADVLPGTLGLTDAELDRVTAGTLVIGRADSASSISVTAAVQPAVTANLILVTARNIVVNTGASLTVVGNLTLLANQQTTATSGLFTGIELNGGSVSSTTGVVSLRGRGGDDVGGANHGVYLRGSDAPPSVVGGTVLITGIGGPSAGSSNIGVYHTTNSIIRSTGNGAVVVTGTGGGNSASAGGNIGVLVSANASITAGGVGTVTVTGTGGAGDGTGTGNFGVSVTGSGAAITSGGGAVSVTGTGTPNSFALSVTANGLVASGGTGTLTLTADSIDLDGTAVVRAGASGTATATIRPNTAGTIIDLGGADVLAGSPLTLGLTDAELDRVSAGTLVLGRTTAGALTVSAPLTRPAATDVQLISGAGIAFTGGGVNTGGGTLNVLPNTGFTPTVAGPDATASSTTFANGTVLNVAIAGPTPDTQHTQLNATGAVDLTGVSLNLSGGYVPVIGDSFTLVSAASVVGTFTGLPNGATVTFNGVTLRVVYTPTAVILRVNRAPTNVSAGGPYTVAEGSGLTVSAPAATDADGDALTYTWDVNGDGTFGDEVGAVSPDGGRTVTFTAAQMAALGLSDGPRTVNTLAVRASDGAAVGTSAFGTLTITNVPPTITGFVVPPSVRVNQPVAVSATATDPAGVNDPLSFAWVVTLGGATVASGSGAAFTFTPTAAGIYNVSVTVSDGDGGAVSATAGVTVTDVLPPVFVAPPLVFGNAGRVRVIYPNGTTRDLEPFPGFLGDVTVASADMNGDGVPEVVVGAGAGGGPHVVVFDGATGAVTASFFAYDVAFTGGVYVAATADGRIITGAGAFGGPHVKVIDYARTGQKLPNGQIADSALVTTFFAYDVAFIGGVRVAAGDVTGDGVADIVTGAGPGGGPHVKVYDGATYAVVRSFFAFDATFANGVYVAAANGWLAAGAGTWGGPHVRLYDDTGSERLNFFAYPTDFIGGVRVAFADVDADGTPDVVTAPGLGGGQPVKATRLSDLTSITSIAPFDPLDPLGVFVG